MGNGRGKRRPVDVYIGGALNIKTRQGYEPCRWEFRPPSGRKGRMGTILAAACGNPHTAVRSASISARSFVCSGEERFLCILLPPDERVARARKVQNLHLFQRFCDRAEQNQIR